MAPRINFEHKLASLSKDVEEMSHIVECEFIKLFEALQTNDIVALQRIEKNDRNINEMQHRIESKCLSLITRQQPIARDLRLVSAALKVVTDIERIGDHVTDIAELLIRLNLPDISMFSAHITGMVDATREMLHNAVEAFVNKDMAAAKQVIKDDDIIDELFNKAKNDIINYLKTETNHVDTCIDILLIAKYLEKVGDHATNIAEWEIFQETGEVENTRLL